MQTAQDETQVQVTVQKDSKGTSKQDALAKARAARDAKRAAGELVRLDPVERAKLKPKSLALAIRAKCWECAGGGQDPGTRRAIAECEVRSCPLHPVRPR